MTKNSLNYVSKYSEFIQININIILLTNKYELKFTYKKFENYVTFLFIK